MATRPTSPLPHSFAPVAQPGRREAKYAAPERCHICSRTSPQLLSRLRRAPSPRAPPHRHHTPSPHAVTTHRHHTPSPHTVTTRRHHTPSPHTVQISPPHAVTTHRHHTPSPHLTLLPPQRKEGNDSPSPTRLKEIFTPFGSVHVVPSEASKVPGFGKSYGGHKGKRIRIRSKLRMAPDVGLTRLSAELSESRLAIAHAASHRWQPPLRS